MSWTNECVESNYFKVTNTEEVCEVLDRMGFGTHVDDVTGKVIFYSNSDGAYFDEDTEVVMALKPVNDRNLIGVLLPYNDEEPSLEDLLEEHNLTRNDVIVQSVTEFLEDSLETGSGIAITTSGFDERSAGTYNPFGDVIIIAKTKNEIVNRSISLYSYISQVGDEIGVDLH